TSPYLILLWAGSGVGPARPIAPVVPGEEAEEGRDPPDPGTDQRDRAAEQFKAELPDEVPDQEPDQRADEDAAYPQQDQPERAHASPPISPAPPGRRVGTAAALVAASAVPAS